MAVEEQGKERPEPATPDHGPGGSDEPPAKTLLEKLFGNDGIPLLGKLLGTVAIVIGMLAGIAAVIGRSAIWLDFGVLAAIFTALISASILYGHRKEKITVPVVTAVMVTAGVIILAGGISYLAWRLSGPSATPPIPGRSPAPQSSRPGASPPARASFILPDPDGDGVAGVAFSRDGSHLATGDINGTTYLWDMATRTHPVKLRNPNGQPVFGVAFDPHRPILASADDKQVGKATFGSVSLWDTAAHRLITTLHVRNSRGFDGVAFSPNGSILAAANDDGQTYLWKAGNYQPVGTLPDPDGRGVNSVAFSPNGKTLAAADNNGGVYLWNMTTHTPTTIRAPGGPEVNGVAFSPDGTMLAAGDSGGTIYLWDLPTHTPTTLHAPPGQEVGDVAFSPDGKVLAATITNMSNVSIRTHPPSTRLWEVATHTLIATFHDHNTAGLFRLAFSPDGSILAVGDGNTRCYLWSMGWLNS
jgi:dipeptidyl aminopeptidase/acylaminoacyl peptidase